MSGNFITMFVTHISHNYVASKINIKEEYEQGKNKYLLRTWYRGIGEQ